MQLYNIVLSVFNSYKIKTIPIRKNEFKIDSNHVTVPENTEWTLKLLSVLMKELKDWQIDENNGCRKRTHTNQKSHSCVNLVSTQKKLHYININTGSSIVVKISDENPKTRNNEPTNISLIQKCFIITISSFRSK